MSADRHDIYTDAAIEKPTPIAACIEVAVVRPPRLFKWVGRVRIPYATTPPLLLSSSLQNPHTSTTGRRDGQLRHLKGVHGTPRPWSSGPSGSRAPSPITHWISFWHLDVQTNLARATSTKLLLPWQQWLDVKRRFCCAN